MNVCVIGSINMDYVTVTKRLPVPGETLIGENFYQSFGGKGANQAIAMGKLGVDVSFIGACGNDSIYEQQIDNFNRYGVRTSGIEIVDSHSGVAQITLCEGENQIIIVPGANEWVDKDLVLRHINLIDEADIVVLQLEIPMDTVRFVIDYAYNKGKVILLNPAPMQTMDDDMIDKCTYITPNEIEIKQMFGADYDTVLPLYPNKMIMTKGKEGAYYYDGNQLLCIEGIAVDAVDTTGAGDTFNGAFVAGLTLGYGIEKAIGFANKAASIAVQGYGAQTAMPTMKEMEEK